MDALRTSIREFCEFELELKATQDIHRKACEPSIVRRNTAYGSLVRVMQDDDLHLLELPTGGFLRRSTVKTQCALKRELVEAAVESAVADFKRVSRDIPSMQQAREALLKLIQTRVREHRTSEVVKVSHVETLPRGVSGDIPRANEFIASTASEWMQTQQALGAARRDHVEAKKALDARRDALLGMPGVREYMKRECPDGKPVRIQGHDTTFTLRYSVSSRRRPIREAQVQDAITHSVNTLVHDPATPVSASAIATLIMDTALENAGSDTNDTYTLCARTGRKRAANGETRGAVDA